LPEAAGPSSAIVLKSITSLLVDLLRSMLEIGLLRWLR
jgi:hypothetical protein